MTTTDYHTHPEYIALLEQVRTNPADDAPRLVIADWIEEAGNEERAAWIRVSIAAAQQTDNCNRFHDYKACDCPRCKHEAMKQSRGKEFIACGKLLVINYESRGFVSEVRLTCAEFMGGPCEACQGRPKQTRFRGPGATNPYWWDCDHCPGTGRIPGVARELFELHPLTAIKITCREPWDLGGGNCAWWPDRGPHVYNKATLPSDIYARLKPYLEAFGGQSYPTEADALVALSDACVAYGRETAGLPALEAKR